MPSLSISISPTSTSSFFFFFNDTATTEIYTLSLHDALPIFPSTRRSSSASTRRGLSAALVKHSRRRSEEHTSELQSRLHLVCRLLLEKKKQPARPVADHLRNARCNKTARVDAARPRCTRPHV